MIFTASTMRLQYITTLLRLHTRDEVLLIRRVIVLTTPLHHRGKISSSLESSYTKERETKAYKHSHVVDCGEMQFLHFRLSSGQILDHGVFA